MGCVASRLEEEEVVSICRERKRLLKLALERRYALADAHDRYCHSLVGVSAAINLFVARHSSPPFPFDISTIPSSSPPTPTSQKDSLVSNPLFLQQTPSQPIKETIPCGSCISSSSSSSSISSEEDWVEREKNEQEVEERVCRYSFMDMPQGGSPQRDFGWDFFNPFNTVARPENVTVFNRVSEEDLRAVREQEGIPELEDDEQEETMERDRKSRTLEKEMVNAEHKEVGVGVGAGAGAGAEVVNTVDCAKMVSHGEQFQKGPSVINTPVRGRELLEALKDIEDHFVRAYDSGKEVSRMLECNRVHWLSNLDEIKESSTKLIQSIQWRSVSSRSSSSKSLVASSSRSSSTWTEYNNELFGDLGGMNSGSLSSTLGRLYAWEKKLYEEVKDGDTLRRIYQKKCNHLRNQDVRGEEGVSVDKTRSGVKDLYSRILVAIRSAEAISSRIEKLIDEELEPQISELLQGMMKTWKIMLESHEIQYMIIFDVRTSICPSSGKFCNESHRLATQQLETEILNWGSCLVEYVSAQKRCVSALYGWLSKFVAPEVEFCSRRKSLGQACLQNGPSLLTLSHEWLDSMNRLPNGAASFAIKSCAKDVRALLIQQGEEQKQKRKVDSLSKELDKKILALQKSENKNFQLRLMDKNTELEMDNQAESLAGHHDMLEDLRRRVDLEKEKHKNCMRETERITLNGLQTGFCQVFESMLGFSRASLKMYVELCNGQSTEKVGKPACIEQNGGSSELELH